MTHQKINHDTTYLPEDVRSKSHFIPDEAQQLLVKLNADLTSLAQQPLASFSWQLLTEVERKFLVMRVFIEHLHVEYKMEGVQLSENHKKLCEFLLSKPQEFKSENGILSQLAEESIGARTPRESVKPRTNQGKLLRSISEAPKSEPLHQNNQEQSDSDNLTNNSKSSGPLSKNENSTVSGDYQRHDKHISAKSLFGQLSQSFKELDIMMSREDDRAELLNRLTSLETEVEELKKFQTQTRNENFTKAKKSAEGNILSYCKDNRIDAKRVASYEFDKLTGNITRVHLKPGEKIASATFSGLSLTK